MNPFIDEYCENEIKRYGISEYKNGNVEIKSTIINGRCDDYLNKNFRITKFKIPVMFINGKLWMSLSFMEVQSHYLPIIMAEGKVLCGGLGMGYFVSSIMEGFGNDVESIDVYEINHHIIDFFKKMFKDKEGFDKVKFINKDIRKMKNKEYDFAFIDIYQDMDFEKIVEDMVLLHENNIINRYHAWGQERLRFEALNNDLILLEDLPYQEKMYYSYWMKTGKHNMFMNVGDDEIVERYLEVAQIL